MKFYRLSTFALLALAVGGCSTDVSSFSVADLNPLKGEDPLRRSDYNYFYKNEQAVRSGPITAADLIGPDGRCAFEPAPAMAAPSAAPDPVAAAPGAEPVNPRTLYFTAGPQAGGNAGAPAAAMPPELRNGPSGISLKMTECQVVSVAGYTDRVEIAANERGERTVTLTYLSGNRPGIYRFRGGRLVSMERVAESPQAKKPAAKTAKKQPAR